ncbi:MAG: excinuclease ABC subunit UvrC [Clostridia bacterium]|nr:excinuclease ABC subunit UvrC [Clostridia bacterium]
MFDIKENLKKLPDCPGVYLHKDKLGEVIYVGKAISLKNRVRQYFQSSRNHDAKVRAMVSHIAEFEYITVSSEMEALILECNLIKKYMPKYNVLLRDDKTYPYIKVTMNEEFPRLLKTRRVLNDGSKYFGPYSDAGAVNRIIELLSGIYALKHCSAKSFPEGFRPCLNYHIGRCAGICTGNADRELYLEHIEKILAFLSGKGNEIEDNLRAKMQEASEKLDFETAAKYRDYILAVKALSEKQRVTMPGAKDMDVILPVRTAKKSYAALFSVRGGKLSGRETFALSADESDSSEELMSAFLKQYYAEGMLIPKEIVLGSMPLEAELIENYLSQLRGSKVNLIVPVKGEKKALLDLARKNVIEMTKTIDEREKNRQERAFSLGREVHNLLEQVCTSAAAGTAGKPEPAADAVGQEPGEYKGRQYRIEAYDISNTNGVDSVGAMVVFVGPVPQKKDYRRFRIRTIEGPNDYGSLQEVIYRRFRRMQDGDPAFSKMPDALFIDGGANQVSVVLRTLYAMKLTVPVIGMAKDDHHRTRALVYLKNQFEVYKDPDASYDYCELPLAQLPLLFKYTGTIQEEVHRFAIEYHKGLRGKHMQGSALDEIPGVGPARRNALLARFGSIEAIRGATEEELMMTEGITKKVAENIINFFRQ